MNYQETVDYLYSYKDLHYRLEYLNNRIEGIKAIGPKNQGNGSRKTLNDYLDEKHLIEHKMSQIEDLIGNIEDYRQRLTVEYKFLEFMTLEDAAERMNYSLSQVKRYYRKGIVSLVTNKKTP